MVQWLIIVQRCMIYSCPSSPNKVHFQWEVMSGGGAQAVVAVWRCRLVEKWADLKR